MARPAKWNSKTTSVRIPVHAVEAVMSLAYHLDNQPTGVLYKKSLRAELIQLIRRHEPLLEGQEEWVNLITSPRYMKRTLLEDVLNQKYRDISFALAGHQSNEGCKGMFAHIEGDQVDQMLLLLLIELLSSVERPMGGSVHQLGKGVA
jgi:hypothetical protein